MPVVPGVETPSRRAIRLESLPGLLRIANAPLESVAIPAESYPRYSSRFNPSIRRGAASREPTYPTIPHIGWVLIEGGEEQTGGLGDGATGRKSPSLLPPPPAPPSPRPPVTPSPRPPFPAANGPARDVLLGDAGQGEGVRGNVFRDGRAGADIGAVSHGHGRHELTVAADEGAATDRRAVLLFPVVVAGDDAGADVRVRADLRVSKVGEVQGLHPPPQERHLGFDEVSDAHVFLEHRARPQAREGPDAAARADRGREGARAGRREPIAAPSMSQWGKTTTRGPRTESATRVKEWTSHPSRSTDRPSRETNG